MTNPYTRAALIKDSEQTLQAAAARHRLHREARSGKPQNTAARRWIARMDSWLISQLHKGALRPLASEIPTVSMREPSLAAWIDSLSEHAFTPAAERPPASLTEAGVLIRPIGIDDRALLADGFARLSANSRRLRFHGTKESLSPVELDYLTNVDHRDREALVAAGRVDGRGIGVARYTRDPNDPQTAEVAVTVIDEWHRRGVGKALITRLITRATDEGIGRFTALVTNENVGSIKLLRSLDLEVSVLDRDHETTEYEIRLANAQPQPQPQPQQSMNRSQQ